MCQYISQVVYNIIKYHQFVFLHTLILQFNTITSFLYKLNIMASYVFGRYPIKTYNFHIPDKNILIKGLEDGMKQKFQDVIVEIVKCPDLTEQPFNLAGPGLCDETAIIDLGETTNLPVSQKKVYFIEDIITSLNCSYVTPFIFGDTFIAKRPSNEIYELAMNASFSPHFNEQGFINKSCVSHIAKCQTDMLTVNNRPQCIERGTFFLCDNSSTQDVIQICAKKGRSSFLEKVTEFTDALQSALYQMRNKYVLALGGVYKTNNVIWKHRVYPNLELEDTSSRPSICTVEMPAIRMALFNSDIIALFNRNISGYTSRFPLDNPICTMTSCLSHHSLAERHCTIYAKKNNDIEYLGYFTPVETLHCVDKPTDQQNLRNID